jgi:hypothetical protein
MRPKPEYFGVRIRGNLRRATVSGCLYDVLPQRDIPYSADRSVGVTNGGTPILCSPAPESLFRWIKFGDGSLRLSEMDQSSGQSSRRIKH